MAKFVETKVRKMERNTYDPYWLTPSAFLDLRNFLKQDFIEENTLLNDLQLEVGVAKTRTSSLRIKTQELSSALGMENGSMPIYLNAEERNYLLSHTSLPDSVRRILL